MKELLIRTVVGIGLLAMLALVLFFGGWVQVAVLSLFSALSVYEMQRMFQKKAISPFTIPQYLLALSQFTVLYLGDIKWVALLYICCFMAIVIERIFNKKRQSEDVISAVFVMIYPLALLLCMGLIGFGRDDVSRVALLLVFAGPCMADNNAYIFGMLFGKKKLCPHISPKKTIEGYLAGIVGGPAGGLIVWLLQEPLFGQSVHWLWLVGLGFIGGVIGQFGDLFASTFKRWADIKDFGTIFPKHGGTMDRLDSSMLFAPIVAVVFSLFIV